MEGLPCTTWGSTDVQQWAPVRPARARNSYKAVESMPVGSPCRCISSMGGQHMEQNQLGSLGAGDLAGECSARAGGPL